MERFRQTVEYIKRHLGGLSPTHKLLVGSTLVVLLMAALLVSQYAGRRSMAHIVIDGERRPDAATLLRVHGIDYSEDATGISVPQNRHMEAFSLLSQNNVMGSQTNASLLELIQSQQWWHNRQQNQQNLNAAMGQYLSQIISGWSYVQKATVVVTAPLERRGLGQHVSRPTASVVVSPRNGALTQEQVESIAEFVAGAVTDLDPFAVRIVDESNGRSMRVRDPQELSAGTYMELAATIEQYCEQKISDTLRFIPQVIVAVNAQVDATRQSIQNLEYKPEGRGSLSLPGMEESTRTSQSQRTTGSASGVQPNVGTDLGARTTATGPSTEASESSTTFENYAGRRENSVSDPRGFARKINATIGVPRSYFVMVWQQRNPDVEELPTDDQLQPIITEVRDRIREMVLPLIDTAALADDPTDAETRYAGEVVVSQFYDFDTTFSPGAGEAMEAGAISVPGLEWVSGSVREIALGVLALVSLFFMFKLVKGTAAGHRLPTAEELVGIPHQLRSEQEELLGDADESEAPMEALELTDDEIRVSKMMEQVDDLIHQNPDDAARLVGRWIEEGN